MCGDKKLAAEERERGRANAWVSLIIGEKEKENTRAWDISNLLHAPWWKNLLYEKSIIIMFFLIVCNTETDGRIISDLSLFPEKETEKEII